MRDTRPPHPAPAPALSRRRLRGLLPLLLLGALATGGARPTLAAAASLQDSDNDNRIPGGQMVRGVIGKVSGDSFTVKTETGETVTVVATTNTRVMRSRQTGRLRDIHVGDGIGAAGILDSSTRTLHAAFIGVVDAEEVKRAQAELGKSYIVGKITAMEDLRLTIQRPDGVSQTIAVDEGTSFRRGGRANFGALSGGDTPSSGSGGESITLADIKVGESVAGRGFIKGNLFTPTELHVFSDNAGHRRSRPAGDSDASAPTSGTGSEHP